MSDLKAQLQCNAKTFLDKLLAALESELAEFESSLPGGRKLSLTPRDGEHILLLEGVPGGSLGYYLSATGTTLSAATAHDMLGRIDSYHLQPQWDEARGECVVFVGIEALNAETFKRMLLSSLLSQQP